MMKMTIGALLSLVLTTATTGLAQEEINIALIGKTEFFPGFVVADRGARQTARKLSSELGVRVEVTTLTPGPYDVDLQRQAVAKAVSSGVDAILISPISGTDLTPAIDQAVESGVAVMTFDNDAPQSKRFSHYGPNDFSVGEMVMNELALQIGERGKVAILTAADANLEERARGAEASARAYPDIDVVGPFILDRGEPHLAAKRMMEVHEEHPDLKGWALVVAQPLLHSSMKAALLEDLTRRQIRVVATDALPDQLVFVQKGVAILMAQPVIQWGVVGVSTIVDKLHRGVAVPEHIEMELVRVGPENLAQWATELKNWGFSVDPSFYE